MKMEKGTAQVRNSYRYPPPRNPESATATADVDPSSLRILFRSPLYLIHMMDAGY